MSCGCDSNMGCTCSLAAGPGIGVSGIGTAGDPFVISNTQQQLGVADTPSVDLNVTNAVITAKVKLDAVLDVADTDSVDLALTGAGTEEIPFTLSAVIKGMILNPATSGQVLTYGIDGFWRPGPPTQAPVGSIVTAGGLRGDGSGANPFRVYPGTYAEWEGLTI